MQFIDIIEQKVIQFRSRREDLGKIENEVPGEGVGFPPPHATGESQVE